MRRHRLSTLNLAGLAAALVLGALVLVAPARAQVCLTGSTGPDLIVWELPTLANYSSNAGYEALSIATTSCNIGDVRSDWFANDSRHPVISQNLYRLNTADGLSRFEHVGRSWLKHGFFSTNSDGCCGGCVPTAGTFLEPKCSDPYSANRNGLQNFLGPRYPVNAHTGTFPYPFTAPPWSGNARRLEVAIEDLSPTNSTPTQYFAEGHYVAADDAAAGNGNNNASWREVTAFRLGTEWLFGFTGATTVAEPAIRAWKANDPGVEEVDVQLPGEGLLVLAFKVTPTDAGWWSYEYALYNMNSDDSVRSFRLPLADGVLTRNEGFHGLPYRAGDGKSGTNVDSTEWTRTLSGGELGWSTDAFADNDNANALRWGSLMNFRFEANAPPGPGTLTLGRYKSGLDHTVAAEVPLAPPGLAYCEGSDTSCPQDAGCGAGGAGRGCVNSSGRGALLRMTGTPGQGDETAWASGMPTRTIAVLLRSTQQMAGGAGAPFGDGLMCVGDPKDRIAAGLTSSGSTSFPLQHADGAGTWNYQVLYRNHRSFCTPARFNLSNGYSVTFP